MREPKGNEEEEEGDRRKHYFYFFLNSAHPNQHSHSQIIKCQWQDPKHTNFRRPFRQKRKPQKGLRTISFFCTHISSAPINKLFFCFFLEETPPSLPWNDESKEDCCCCFSYFCVRYKFHFLSYFAWGNVGFWIRTLPFRPWGQQACMMGGPFRRKSKHREEMCCIWEIRHKKFLKVATPPPKSRRRAFKRKIFSIQQKNTWETERTRIPMLRVW